MISFSFEDLYNPFTSERLISTFAPIICATLAAKRSLSPYLISEVAVVSFSFTICIAYNLKRFSKVLLAFIALLLCYVSSNDIKICPI